MNIVQWGKAALYHVYQRHSSLVRWSALLPRSKMVLGSNPQLSLRFLTLYESSGSSGLPRSWINLRCKWLFVLDLSAGHNPGLALALATDSGTRSSSAYPHPSPARNLHSFFTLHFLSLFCPWPVIIYWLMSALSSHHNFAAVCNPPPVLCCVGGDGGGGISCISTALPSPLGETKRMGWKNRWPALVSVCLHACIWRHACKHENIQTDQRARLQWWCERLLMNP